MVNDIKYVKPLEVDPCMDFVETADSGQLIQLYSLGNVRFLE